LLDGMSFSTSMWIAFILGPVWMVCLGNLSLMIQKQRATSTPIACLIVWWILSKLYSGAENSSQPMPNVCLAKGFCLGHRPCLVAQSHRPIAATRCSGGNYQTVLVTSTLLVDIPDMGSILQGWKSQWSWGKFDGWVLASKPVRDRLWWCGQWLGVLKERLCWNAPTKVKTVALETMTIKVILYLLLLKSSLGTSGSHMHFH